MLLDPNRDSTVKVTGYSFSFSPVASLVLGTASSLGTFTQQPSTSIKGRRVLTNAPVPGFVLLTALMAFAPLGLAFSDDVKSLQVDRPNSDDDGKSDAESGHEDDGEGEGGESESPVGVDFEMVSPASMNSSS